jgi:hypothetical protein
MQQPFGARERAWQILLDFGEAAHVQRSERWLRRDGHRFTTRGSAPQAARALCRSASQRTFYTQISPAIIPSIANRTQSFPTSRARNGLPKRSFACARTIEANLATCNYVLLAASIRNQNLAARMRRRRALGNGCPNESAANLPLGERDG